MRQMKVDWCDAVGRWRDQECSGRNQPGYRPDVDVYESRTTAVSEIGEREDSFERSGLCSPRRSTFAVQAALARPPFNKHGGSMRKFIASAAGATLALGALGLGLAPTASAAAPCPSGAVCIREPDGSILPKNIFYQYGAHNLEKVLGVRDVVNNQTGGAGYQICRGYNGTNCGGVNRLVTTISYDMTPVNSVVLVK